MIDLLSFYRDVLTTQMGSDVERVNLDLSDAVDQAARTTTPEQSLARIAAIEECRSRLRSNAAPLLAVEASWSSCAPRPREGDHQVLSRPPRDAPPSTPPGRSPGPGRTGSWRSSSIGSGCGPRPGDWCVGRALRTTAPAGGGAPEYFIPKSDHAPGG